MSEESEVLDLFEVKRRYWEFMLPRLQGAFARTLNEEDEPYYSKSYPRRANAMDAYIEKHVCLRCGLAQRKATVDLYFASSEKQENKDHFDELYSFRRAIERKMGCGLSWDRMDELKTSKVYLELTGVDLYDSSEWEKIAAFHVEWARKFYDVLLPYVSFIIQNG